MPPETNAAAGESAPAPASCPTVLVQFLTLGGADVDLYEYRFETRYLPIGRPYVGDVRTVDGFRWQCRGCGEVGQPALFTNDYLPKELPEARTHANRHASSCRSKPRPSVSSSETDGGRARSR